MSIKIFQVDAFTSEPFKGNPAAVCILENEVSDEWMSGVAADMNLAETAFITTTEEKNKYKLRWFTPKVEVDLCGHATLATAHILYQNNYVHCSEAIFFETKSGILKTLKNENHIQLDFPETPVSDIEIPEGIENAIGAKIIYAGKSIFDYFFLLESEDVLIDLKPNFNELIKFGKRGVIVTADSKKYDFISRFFAPQSGINEDPVTGSAHCALYPYWSKKLNKKELVAYQASERGGLLKLSSESSRVLISGEAITIFEGILKI